MERRRILKALVHSGFLGLLAFTWIAGRAPRSKPEREFAFELEEVSQRCGIRFVHQAPEFDARLAHIMPDIASTGAAVSVVDANGDGWMDLYVTNSAFGAPNALYVNDGRGGFRDQAREAGVADVNRPGEGVSMGSVWADADNDGDLDLFLYKYGYAQYFRNEGGLRFVDATRAAGLRRFLNANAAVWLDYDRDGLVDLYVCGYYRDDVDLWHLGTTRILNDSFEFSANGGHNYLYRNLGDGRFEDVTARLGVDSTRWTLAAAAADMNGDGWIDLYLANDYGVEELFLNERGTRFSRAVGVGLEESSKSGMCVALGDFLGEGALGIYVTNISKAGYLFEGNNLRINRLARQGRLENVAEGLVADCGWAWGAQFGDLDNDGRQDLFVVNGFISASPERDYWFEISKLGVGAGSLAEDAANWPPIGDKSLSGYERSRVLVNQGRGRFVDAAANVGATDLDDGRAVALADLWNRGALDVVIANQKGPLRVYRNTVDPTRHWIQFELSGTTSNRAAIGAQVTLHANGLQTTAVVQAGSGFSAQNDLRLHFGLGSSGRAQKAVIRWPSGREQTIVDLRADALNRIVEPAP